MLLEYKAFPFECKNEDGGRFSGYASAYAKDIYGDRIAPGAFAKSIKRSKGKIPILYNHNEGMPLGFSSSLVEDSKGLYIEALLSLESTAGRDAYALLKTAKDVDFPMGLSIGFIAEDEDYDEKEGRLLKTISLWETSITPYPANRAARIDGFKSIRDFESILRDAGCSKDEAKRALACLQPFLSADTDGRDARNLRQLVRKRALRAAIGD